MERESARLIGKSCFALHMRRAARQISRFYDEALRPAGLTNGQFSLMTMLAARDYWRLGDVAEQLGLDRTTLNATLKPLERSGLVRSDWDPEDARVRRLSLTDEGQERVAAAEPLWAEAQASIAARLGDCPEETFRSQLRQIA